MKLYPHLVLLVLIVLISGCVGNNSILSAIGLDISPTESFYIGSENLNLDVEAIPDEVYEGKTTTLYFDLENTGDIDIRDINLEMTDINQFTGSEDTKKIDILRKGDTYSWNWDFSLPDDIVEDERDVSLRYVFDYKSNTSSIYEIVAMTQAEYSRLERDGDIESMYNLSYFKTKSPVEIDISISKEQPIFEDLEFYLYIELRDTDDGYIENIKTGGLTVEYPDFLEFVKSSDFVDEPANNRISLSRALSFIDKETKKAACKFRVKDVNIVSSGQFKAEASYLYGYYKTLNIKLKPK